MTLHSIPHETTLADRQLCNLAAAATDPAQVLKSVNAATLSGHYKQVEDITAYAGELFQCLQEAAAKTSKGFASLHGRISALQQGQEPASSRSDDAPKGTSFFNKATRPESINTVYNSCRPVPALSRLDKYSTSGQPCIQGYTDPEYCKKNWQEYEWKKMMQNVTTKEKRAQREKDGGRASRTPGAPPVPALAGMSLLMNPDGPPALGSSAPLLPPAASAPPPQPPAAPAPQTIVDSQGYSTLYANNQSQDEVAMSPPPPPPLAPQPERDASPEPESAPAPILEAAPPPVRPTPTEAAIPPCPASPLSPPPPPPARPAAPIPAPVAPPAPPPPPPVVRMAAPPPPPPPPPPSASTSSSEASARSGLMAAISAASQSSLRKVEPGGRPAPEMDTQTAVFNSIKSGNFSLKRASLRKLPEKSAKDEGSGVIPRSFYDKLEQLRLANGLGDGDEDEDDADADDDW
eukprot:jgi/Mesvir1/7999/Mv25314-RA.1